jgi:thiosulfate reductase cytochrome b subunit
MSLPHPLFIRLTHWINAVAVIVMMSSGWAIHNAHPTLPFIIPRGLTLGGALSPALRWHFAAMWLFGANLLALLAYGLLTRRFARKLWPLSVAGIARDLAAAARGRLSHDDVTVYNQVQRLAYLFALASLALAFVTGLAIWKPVQFQALTLDLGDFDRARLLHFLAMAGLFLFLCVHLTMALLTPKSIVAMLRGR